MNKKIGFTTNTLLKSFTDILSGTEEAVKWGAAHGFSWIEIRDASASMPFPYLEGLNRLCRSSGLTPHYAWDGDVLLDGDAELFARGARNASVFGEGVISRIPVSAVLKPGNGAERGYGPDRFKAVCDALKSYTSAAREHGVTPAFENGFEPLYGGPDGYGFADIMDACPDISMTFDPANAMNKNQTARYSDWSEAKRFFCAYKSRIPYIHVKSVCGRVLSDVFEADADIDWKWIFDNAEDGTLFCVELPPGPDAASCGVRILDAYRRIREFC